MLYLNRIYMHPATNLFFQGGLEKSIQIRSITYGSSTAAAGHQHRDLLLMSNSSGPLGDRSLFDEWIGRLLILDASWILYLWETPETSESGKL